MQNLIPFFIQIIRDYGYLIIFLGTLVGGELIILVAAFLAFLGWLNIYLVIIVSLAGTLLSDSWWYWCGFKLKNQIKSWRLLLCPKRYQEKINGFKKHFDQHYVKFIMLGKFVYGTRIITQMMAGHQKVPYREFIKYNILASSLWLIGIIFIAGLMGLSWNYLAKYNSYSRYFVLSGILVIFIIRFGFNKFLKDKD